MTVYVVLVTVYLWAGLVILGGIMSHQPDRLPMWVRVGLVVCWLPASVLAFTTAIRNHLKERKARPDVPENVRFPHANRW